MPASFWITIFVPPFLNSRAEMQRGVLGLFTMKRLKCQHFLVLSYQGSSKHVSKWAFMMHGEYACCNSTNPYLFNLLHCPATVFLLQVFALICDKIRANITLVWLTNAKSPIQFIYLTFLKIQF